MSILDALKGLAGGRGGKAVAFQGGVESRAVQRRGGSRRGKEVMTLSSSGKASPACGASCAVVGSAIPKASARLSTLPVYPLTYSGCVRAVPARAKQLRPGS